MSDSDNSFDDSFKDSFNDSFEDSLCEIRNNLFYKKHTGSWKSKTADANEFQVNSETSTISFQASGRNYSPEFLMFDFHSESQNARRRSSSSFFEIQRLGFENSIGWVTRKEIFLDFEKATFGMFYGGKHLENGDMILKFHFTEDIGLHARMGSLLERNENSLSVYFYVGDVKNHILYVLR